MGGANCNRSAGARDDPFQTLARLVGLDQIGRAERTGHHRGGDCSQLQVAVASELTQRLIRLVHAVVEALGKDALRLLDDDPAVQRLLQMTGDVTSLLQRPLLQDPDRGHVGEGSGRPDVVGVGAAGRGAKQVQDADDRAAQAQWEGVRRSESPLQRDRGEPRPARRRAQVLFHNRLTQAVAVDARAFLLLQFEQLEDARVLIGARQQVQGRGAGLARREHDPAGVRVHHRCHAVQQPLEVIEQVVVRNQCVR